MNAKMYSADRGTVALQDAIELCNKKALASVLLYEYALPLHDCSLISQSRVEGMEACIQADLEDMAAMDSYEFDGSDVALIPWNSSIARSLPRENALAAQVELPCSPESEGSVSVLASMVWDLLADSYPVWLQGC